ncbi:MAG: MerR family transcriptional regulator [Myxococcota bacterium]
MTRAMTVPDVPADGTARLSIGALARAAGIPVETLRTWERRYGFPSPERSASGQREYTPDTLERLNWVRQALEAGHRASLVVPLPQDQLQKMLGDRTAAAAPDTSKDEDISGDTHENAWLRVWMVAVNRLDAHALDREMNRALGQMGVVLCLTQRLAPFLQELGRQWADRRISVAHEHFATERVREQLARTWMPLAADNRGPVVVLGNLPGEEHVLGLHMVALVLALAGLRLVFLGANVPYADMAKAATQSRATAVAVSLAAWMPVQLARARLAELRRVLPADVDLVVGGGGAPRAVPGVVDPGGLEGLSGWAATLAHAH